VAAAAAMAAGAPAARDGGTEDAAGARDAAAPRPVVTNAMFLGSFPVESHLGRSLFGDANVEITLRFDPTQARASNELVRRLRVPIAPDGSLVLRLPAYPTAHDKPTGQHTRPSFVIDFDDPRFRPLLEEARAKLGPSPSIAALVAFIDSAITKKGFGRGFDIASVVAQRREGDCTEHAVLLVALARAFHLPARFVEGLVLVEVEGKPYAFGHAWAEIRLGPVWQHADAALSGPEPRLYLPLDTIADEGPGFMLSLAQTGAGMLGVRRVIVSERR